MKTEHDIEQELLELGRTPAEPPAWYRIAGELTDRRDRAPKVGWRFVVAGAAMTVLLAPAVAEALSPGVVDRHVIEPISDILPWVRDEPKQVDVPVRDSDVPITDQRVTDVPITDAPMTDRLPSDRVPTDRVPTDEAPTDQAPTDQAPTDQAPTDQAPVDQAPSDGPVQDGPVLTDGTDETDDHDQSTDSGSDTAPGGSDHVDGGGTDTPSD